MNTSLDRLVDMLVPGAKVGRGIIPFNKRPVMQITKEYLEAELVSIRRQKDQARDVFQQASGCETLLEGLLIHMNEPDAQTNKTPQKTTKRPRAK